jgi:hypothetical protein
VDIHPQRLEDMPVDVLEAAAINEAIRLDGRIGLVARRACSFDGRVDLRAAVARRVEQRLDLAGGEPGEDRPSRRIGERCKGGARRSSDIELINRLDK